MFDGPAVVAALKDCGVTHVVWIPDTYLGTWEESLRADRDLQLIRVCREGEAMAVAAGLLIGGKKPVVMIQCTGFFDAGDALRNVVHDLKLPLFVLVGVRSYHLHQQQATDDSCPVFTEPIVRAWNIPHVVIDDRHHSVADLAAAYRKAQAEKRAGIVLLAE